MEPKLGQKKVCANCQAPMPGPYCGACGQPEHGLVRHFSAFAGDFVDTIFNVDSRLLRTIAPLLLRPGYLTTEYLAGRRVRYVTPFRLFFVLCVLAFLALHAATPDVLTVNNRDTETAGERATSAINALKNARLDLIAAQPGATAGEAMALVDTVAEIDVHLQAAGGSAVADDAGESLKMKFGRGRIELAANPVQISLLSDAGNQWINQRVARVQGKLEESRDNPKPLVDALFGALPPMLLVVAPLFALILKVWYAIKRRLYMEHLLVAMHSQAFLSLMLLLMSVSMLVERLWPGTGTVLGWVNLGLLTWTVVYLFLMQKRVYDHDWVMAAVSFSVIGLAYLALIAIGLTGALIAGVLSL